MWYQNAVWWKWEIFSFHFIFIEDLSITPKVLRVLGIKRKNNMKDEFVNLEKKVSRKGERPQGT